MKERPFICHRHLHGAETRNAVGSSRNTALCEADCVRESKIDRSDSSIYWLLESTQQKGIQGHWLALLAACAVGAWIHFVPAQSCFPPLNPGEASLLQPQVLLDTLNAHCTSPGTAWGQTLPDLSLVSVLSQKKKERECCHGSARGHDRHDKEPDGISARKTANGRKMRRKTIAKRILYNGYEGYEETPEDTGARANHVFSQEPAKRRKWRGLNGEDILSCNADYIKFKTKVLGSLQSRSRAELIAMVLSMQREMDSLREQIRSLTACGKLAQTLEELIERSDRWLCGSHEAATPSIPREPERSRPPSHISHPTVLSGRTDERASSEQQGCGQYEVTQTMQTQRNGTLPEQKVITADLLERCNTGTTAQKLTNDLLRSLYDRDCLASHSISGIVNSKRGTPKPALPAHEIQAILRTVQRFFPGKTDSEIKGYIRQKLQNEAKRLRKRPHPADDPLVGSFKEAETTFEH
ncbi:BEN domain-containing protein 6 [Anabarilius grahami]|uniref:BEN domain-containing protein 6 n=1 Tax=Anabarilius grahami TaxID=495550 RepID=A0A3N0Y9M0_ANAGA|nr:BEN domain-containing protein 6 [Anabarilius grahami]